MIGQTISHYKILEKLGEGGMGVVYKAEDSKLKRAVAIKFLAPDLTRDSEARTRFIHEAQAASALDHPNICTIHEIDETSENQIFICMSYYEGDTLKKKIERGPMPPEEAIGIGECIAQGLGRAHRNGIIHRDIKPANILMTADNQVKILDFGLAKLAGQTKLTRAGATLGTVAYMSPEQTRGDAITPRTDIWSLGVVLYEMLTGVLPFKGDYEQAVIYSIINEQPRSIRDLRSGVPKELEQVIAKALEKDPDERYEKMSEILSDLGKITREMKSKAERKVTAETKPVPSVAVLPFVDMSSQKDQEYFCDGLAEELINALTQVKGLHVAARTSAFTFRGRETDIREIGRKLDVSTILEGSVRRAGNRLRITAQLINIADGYHLWSDKYDRNMEDIFAIQDEISLAIVDKLKIKLLGEEVSLLVKRGTESIEAYDLYMRGRFFWEKRGLNNLEKAIEYFKEAIEEDTNYAAPYAGIADSYNLLSFYGFLPSHDAMPKAREYAQKALKIDETFAEAHSTLAYICHFYDWDFTNGEKEYKRAIELNPAYTPAHYWYSSLLSLTGRFDEALRENEQAIKVDPLSVHAHTQYGWVLIGMRRFEQSIERLKRALELNPDYMLAHWLLGCNWHLLSRYENALTELHKAVELSDRNPWMISTLGSLYGRLGKTSEAREVLTELIDKSKREYVQAFYFAYAYIGLGELDEALAWLEKSYKARDLYFIVPVMQWDPLFEDHMNDPRMLAFFEKARREVIT